MCGGATGAARPDGGLGIVVVGSGVERRMRLLVYGVQKQEVLEPCLFHASLRRDMLGTKPAWFRHRRVEEPGW